MDTDEAGKEVEDFEDFIYAKRQKIANVDEEIVKNLGEDLADRDVVPLGSWHRRQVDFSCLGKMAWTLLANSVPVSLPSVLLDGWFYLHG